MKHILLILKEPFLDRIPSLKTLIWYLMNKDYKITLITSKSDKFTLLSFEHQNLRVIKVGQRTRKLELPTTIKLVLRTLLFVMIYRPDCLMGGDATGNIIASRVAHILKKRYIFFMLEYPQVITKKVPALTKMQILENKSLIQANLIITHDKWHKQFLLNHFELKDNSIFLLPNSSFTPEVSMKSSFLQERFGIKDQKIILHSGGFGRWFRSKELADSTSNWANDTRLVFHISHNLQGDSYFESVYNSDYNGRVLFSLEPVSTYELDTLVASADIGIALYSEAELDYRATYMGLAAGKIGNYLKCGVPVVATKLPSLSYLEEYNCGILVAKESEIADAIHQILSNRDMYSKNAHRCYRELWYSKSYLQKIEESLL